MKNNDKLMTILWATYKAERKEPETKDLVDIVWALMQLYHQTGMHYYLWCISNLLEPMHSLIDCGRTMRETGTLYSVFASAMEYLAHDRVGTFSEVQRIREIDFGRIEDQFVDYMMAKEMV